jgi:transglutaminase-like putative cysteine protease
MEIPEEAGASSPGGRVVLLTALGLLVVTGTVAFGRVFEEDATTWKLLAAGLGALALAALLERRHVLLAAAVSIVGLAFAVAWLVYPKTLWHNLPSLDSWDALLRSLARVGRTAAAHTAPSPTLAPLLLAALVAVWCSSFAAHALAARARSPYLAILPPVALLAFAGVVMRDDSRPIYVIPFLVACLAVLFADALYRVGQWGPLTVWHEERHSGPWRTVGWVRSARRVSLAALAVALFAPWVLPGFSSTSLYDLRGGDEGGSVVSIDPIADIRTQLLEQTGTELFTVRTARPSYWRIVGLERFDGDRWDSPDLFVDKGQAIHGGALELRDVDPTLGPPVKQTYTFDGAVQAWLPAMYPARAIDTQGELIRYDPSTGTMVLPGNTFRDFGYSVTSYSYTPTPEDLDAIPSLAGRYPARLTELPPDTPQQIYDIAHEWASVGGATIPYRQILNIQNVLKSFTYSEQAPVADGTSAVLDFLTRTRRGFCVQFAGSMAVLVRALGYPARVAVGYTPGTRDRSDRSLFHVSGKQAHEWVEVLFPKWGWLPFEPTPGRFNPTADGFQTPATQGGSAPGPLGNAGDLQDSVQNRRLNGDAPLVSDTQCSGPRAQECPDNSATKPTGEATGLAPPTWFRWLPWLGLALLLLALAIPVGKLFRRRWLVSRAASPRERILVTYDVMADRAADVGLGRRSGETLDEYRARLVDRVEFSNGHLGRLTRIAGAAAYSGHEPNEEDVEQAEGCARQVEHDVRRSSGPVRVAMGWFRVELPRSRTRS